MQNTTGLSLTGFRVTREFGVVRGIVVRSRSVIGNIGASLQTLFGGDITLYTELCEHARQDAYERLCEEASHAPAGANGLYWAPYLMGERTPHCDPNARAAWIGLTASHTRAHMVRAILEGVAFSLRDSLSVFHEIQVPVKTVRLGGGGSRSELWRQIQADVYGQTVEQVATEEDAAYGATILAGVGAGVWKSVDEACDEVVKAVRRIEPDARNTVLMEQNYQTYRRIYPALRQIFHTASD